jgi:hypothetical protein
VARDAANRWLDNVQTLMSWAKKQFPGHEDAINNLFGEVSIRSSGAEPSVCCWLSRHHLFGDVSLVTAPSLPKPEIDPCCLLTCFRSQNGYKDTMDYIE